MSDSDDQQSTRNTVYTIGLFMSLVSLVWLFRGWGLLAAGACLMAQAAWESWHADRRRGAADDG